MEFLIIYTCFIIGMFVATIKDFNNIAVTPKEMYECNEFNLFACVVLWIFMFMFNPLFYLAQFIYWIFHVGRFDD